LQKRTKSILAELDTLVTHRDKGHFVESRAANVIQSAINQMSLMKIINKNRFAIIVIFIFHLIMALFFLKFY
jgi:hypothetical protein